MRTLLNVSFKHILISLINSIGIPNSNEYIVQYVSLHFVMSLLKIYK
jgi:hypothetical protein